MSSAAEAGPRRGEALWAALLFAFGLAVCLHYGRRGYMPLDQSIVFDGGWRILSGQVPFRDFDLAHGLLPSALQAGFFAALGVSWWVYCLHAALLNGLFCVVVQRLLLRTGATPLVAGVFGAASGLACYPPFGVPYSDQHAFILLALALSCALRGGRAGLASAGVALAAALLCKPNPTLYGAPLVVAAAWAWHREARALVVLALGALAALALAALVLVAVGAEPGAVWLDLWARPGGIAERRVEAWSLGDLLGRALLRSGLALPALALAAGAGLLLAGGRRAGWRHFDPGAVSRVALAAGLAAVGAAYCATTANQSVNGVAFAFLSAGLLFTSAQRARAAGAGAGALAALAIVAGASLHDAARLLTGALPQRTVHDMVFDAASAERPATPALGFLRYQVPRFYAIRAADLDAAVEALGRAEGNFLLFGDFSILYGLTGRHSVSPSLWWHYGLNSPRPRDPAFAEFRTRLRRRIEELDVRTIVVEGEETLMHASLAHFPALWREVMASPCPVQRFGGFRLHRLPRDGSCE